MNVLIIGNANSIWIKEYIKHIHHKLGNTVYLTDYYGVSESDALYYEAFNVILIPLFSDSDSVLKKGMKMLNFAFKNRNLIELVDIQSPPHSLQSYLLQSTIKILNCRTIVGFWGSDILRINEKDAKKLKGLLILSDKINIATEHMYAVFQSFYSNQFDSRLSFAKYGSPAFSEIDNCLKDKQYYKSYFGFDTTKITVSIGNNGKREQNHIRVIEAIKNSDKDCLKTIELVLHLAYGGDSDYFSEIKEVLDSSGIKYSIIDRLIPIEEVAKLRKATDIFINAQVTDGLSGSMRECFYAESLVVNPSWLEYSELDKLGVHYYQYGSFAQLTELFPQIVENKDDPIYTKQNSRIMYGNYSWDAVFSDWMVLING